MTTALDTNILVALWDDRDSLNSVAAASIERASRDRIVICAAVYAELMAMPGRTENFVAKVLSDLNFEVEWVIDKDIWRSAGNAFSRYAARRRKGRASHPRRILTDFIIGAHAFENNYSLLTLDDKLFRASFPKLKLVEV